MISISTIKKSIYGATTAATFIGVKALALDESAPDTAQNAVNAINPTGDVPVLQEQIQLIINVLIGLIAVAAVVMLIIGGFRYVFSQGEEKATKGAKDTILYAIIGIVVSILAFSITNYVIDIFN